MKGQALIKYFQSNYWAITPSYLDTMQTAFAEWQAGTAIEYKTDEEGTPTNVTNEGVAVLSYSGAFHKRLAGISALSGGISGERVISDLRKYSADDTIRAIVLSLDTPGGTVDGVGDVTEAIKEAKLSKPIVTYADGLLASAGVWIGATSDAIVCNSTAQVGSIGVIMVHQEASKAEASEGIVSTVLTAGKYKGDGNRHEPLSDQARAKLQDSLDFYYSMFVDHVADCRGVSIADCLLNMAEGRMFIGSQALESGLVDKIGNLETAINLALTLGGYNVKKELQEALASMETTELLATLQGHAALPESVTTAISSVVESSEEITIKKAEYNSLTESHASALETLNTLTEANTELKAQVDSLSAELVDLKASTESVSAREALAAQFTSADYEADESLITSLLELSDPQPVIDSMLALHESKKSLAENLATPEGLHGSDADGTAPTSVDEATARIMNESKCDIDEAITEANLRYPELFKRS